eukprot:TRINITY_DN5028_c0_g1_i1.p3 TRINITY_DN5028_c0_g1~~TRINITY_DN5028_c0_g1_i1.p3  ORF type:complete len:113 (+),score=21.68 TRINITY_DN5028_c0_g1_i1:736-1074(+)
MLSLATLHWFAASVEVTSATESDGANHTALAVTLQTTFKIRGRTVGNKFTAIVDFKSVERTAQDAKIGPFPNKTVAILASGNDSLGTTPCMTCVCCSNQVRPTYYFVGEQER